MVKPNSEVRRRLVKQNLVARENNQLLSKKNSFQQVKQRSTLPKRANQKVQRIMKARPKPKSVIKMNLKELSVISLTMLMLFYGHLDVCELIVWGR